MAPISAKAKQAGKVINIPMTQMERNNTGVRVFDATSAAVRKMPDPMIPLASSRIESSSESPRTSFAGWVNVRVPGSCECIPNRLFFSAASPVVSEVLTTCTEPRLYLRSHVSPLAILDHEQTHSTRCCSGFHPAVALLFRSFIGRPGKRKNLCRDVADCRPCEAVAEPRLFFHAESGGLSFPYCAQRGPLAQSF